MLNLDFILDDNSLTNSEKSNAIELYLKDNLINLKEACTLLEISRPTLNKYINEAFITPLIDRGNFTVLNKDDVVKLKPKIEQTKEFFKKKAK